MEVRIKEFVILLFCYSHVAFSLSNEIPDEDEGTLEFLFLLLFCRFTE